MKVTTLFLVVLVLVSLGLSAVLFVKTASMEKRLREVPSSEDFTDKQQDQEEMHRAYKERAESLFESLLRIEDRLTALETGTSGATPDGDESVDWLINSLQRDYLAAMGSSSNPDKESILLERMSVTVQKLIDRQDDGEDCLEGLMLELRLSKENDWKSYLVRDVIWRIPGSHDALMDFFRNRRNDENLRGILASCAAVHFAAREDLEVFADALKDREESLTVKTNIAKLFEQRPFTDAEPGLIEGVVGLRIEEDGKVEIVPFSQQHINACLQALGYHDSARVTGFLRRFLIEQCTPDANDRPNHWNILFTLHAYENAMGDEAVPFLEKLLNDFPGLHAELQKTINGLIEAHKKNDSSGEPDQD